MLNNGQKKPIIYTTSCLTPCFTACLQLVCYLLNCLLACLLDYLKKPNNSASIRSVILRKSSGLSANSRLSPSTMIRRPL